MTTLKVVLFDIGSTLWSSPPEDADALTHCYGRGRAILLENADEAPDAIPPIEALIDAVEGYFAHWEDNWKADPGIVEQAPTTQFVAEALQKLGLEPLPAALAAFTDAVLETSVYTAKVEPPEPGMPEALAGLRDLGLRLGCVSNAFMGAATLHQIMEERSLGRHLDMTISSCEFGYRKPHPSIYLAGAEKMAVQPEEVLFVGDRVEQDVVGPARLGMRTVLTLQYREEDPTEGAILPDAVIQHLSQLPEVARSLLNKS